MSDAATQPSAHVIDVDESNFEQVIQISQEIPVILDFWAEWCGPCKTLGPILESLAEDYDGAFLLAKVDVDKSPQLASYFQAQSIPAVFAIFRGAMVDRFAGALPKAQVDSFLQEVFKRVGIDAKPKDADTTAPMDPVAAEAYWRAALAKNAEDTAAKLALGRLLFVSGAIDEAEALLTSIPASSRDYNAAQAALALKGLLGEVAEAGGEAAAKATLATDPDNVDANYLVALAKGTRGEYGEALTTLVSQIQTGDAEQRERAKGRAQMLFQAAGRGDEVVETQRRRLSRLLF